MRAMYDEQRFEIVEGVGVLYVFRTEAGWQVWLNNKQDFDGVHLAAGGDRDEALNLAVEVLLGTVRTLRNVLAPNGPSRPPDPGTGGKP